MMGSLAHVFRFLSFVVFGATFCYNILYLFIPGVTDTYGGRFKFLTFWNLTMLMIYTGFSVLTSSINNDNLNKVRDLYFSGIVFPLSIIVSSMYWGLALFDRNLLAPPHVQRLIPLNGWYNQTVHSGPFLFVVLDMLITPHVSPSKLKGIGLTMTVASSYLVWICWVAFKTGYWAYPLLGKLNLTGRLLFFMCCLLFTCMIYLVGDMCNKVLTKVVKTPVTGKKE